MANRESKDKALQFLKDWAIPASVVLVGATGAWARFEYALSEHARRIETLELGHGRLVDCGSDGFLCPSTHSTHDQHIRHFFEQELGRAGWRKLVNDYAVNGATWRP
jgi:hypothetical protein